ncbi:MAG: c-type cytochrome, partial [Chloroflexi bacterium]|nr:c-type cytochrome [Chloroflexota bacterium]
MQIKFRWLLASCSLFLMAVVLITYFGQMPIAVSAQAGTLDAPTAAAFARGGCSSCHVIPGIPNAFGQAGPDLSSLGVEAGTRIDGKDAEAYVLESLVDPDAYIVEKCPAGDCPAGVMPTNIPEKLTEAEIERIVAYLLTLDGNIEPLSQDYELVPIEIARPPETSLTPFAEPPKSYSDAQVLLGKYLFFDMRLSGDASVSCATCHQPEHAFTDGQALSDGATGTMYFRNAPTVMNTSFQSYLYWDGRMDGNDMPTLVRDHLVEAHFMSIDGRFMVERIKQVPEYVRLFEDAYGSGPSFGGILKATSAYVQSLNSAPSPYDLYLAGDEAALSAEAVAGLELFAGKAGCADCHNGDTLSDGEFYALGVPENPEIWADPDRHITFRRFFRLFGVPNYRMLTADPGMYALTQQEEDFGTFRTAPLRELVYTAPYMH